MPAPLDCPELASWQALFGEDVPAEEAARYERHLESCPACQERLDRGDVCREAWRRLGRRDGDPTLMPTDPWVLRVLDRLREGRGREPSPGEAADLYFLRPADRPGVLGTLGGYEVQEVIGQGGMGVVLKAYEPALHRLVAIKVLSPALAGSPTARRRFTREARAAAAVSHEHVVAVHGVEEVDGLPYLVMQFVPGESLQARLDRAGPLEVVEAVRVGLQAASGLAAAHAQGLIHRDVKPANLLLEGGLAKVKVTDFGLARTADDAGLTQAGVVAGTPEYMAPEQARGEAVDHRADLFALGSVLYACCTGLPPFRGDAPVAVFRQVSEQEPVPVRTLNPEVPAWLEALIARLLTKDPARRFRSAAEVAALLEGYLAHLQQPATVPAPALPPHPGPANGQGDAEMSFPCSGCGATLKARAELAGTKVKCPRCGTAVAVPPAGPAPRRKRRAVALGVCLVASLGLVLVLLRAWFFAPAEPAAPPSFLDVTLGNRSVPGVEDSGFYNDEQNDTGPFRWTNGRGTLVIPLDRKEPPQALLLRLYRPIGTSLQIAVNDRQLVNEEPTSRDMARWERALDLRGVDLGDRAVVELVSTTVTPRDVDPKKSDDTRALGVQVGGITLLRRLPGDPVLPGGVVRAVREYTESFRGGDAGRSDWVLTPAAREATGGPPVRFEPDGLRITLPPGNPPTGQGTGVSAKLGVQGDFEITVSFDILHEPEPQETEIQTRLSLEVVLARRIRGRHMAALTRMVDARGSQFTAWQVLRDDPAAAETQRAFSRPSAAKAGRLRLRRTGSTLSYAVAEGAGGEFTPLCEFPFAADDLREVRLVGSTGGPKASCDFRFADLHMRAGSLSGVAEAAPVPGPAPVAPGKPAAGGRSWLVAAGLVGLTLVLVFGVAFAARRGRRPGQAPAADPREAGPPRPGPAASIPVACAGCGKGLKVRTALAGKKVRCPGCGQPVPVPEAAPPVPTKAAPERTRGRLLALLGLAAGGLVLVVVGALLVRAARPAPRSFLDVTLGNRAVAGVEDSGFYQDEQNVSGPYRWTDGHAKLVIPLNKNERPQALGLLLLRPKDTWLRVAVNGRELVHERSTDSEIPWWERALDLDGLVPGEPVVLEIESNPIIGRDNDQRPLGVKVREVKLRRDRGGEKSAPEPGSFVNVPLGGRFVRGLEESGFFDEERWGGQPCRWTNGSARLTVPLHGQKPRALALTAYIPNRPGFQVRVTVNGTKLFDDQVKPESIWSCELPLAGVDLGDCARIEVDSSVVVPSKVDPRSKDDRELGIRLKRLILLSDAVAGKHS